MAGRNFLSQIIASAGLQIPTGANAGYIAQSDASGNASWVPPSGITGPTRVTALPGSPTNGQEIEYVADATNGILWNLRWNSTNSKWESCGGGWLKSEFTTTETKNTGGGTTYADFTTATSVTVPIAGDYEVMNAYSGGSNATAPSGNFFISVAVHDSANTRKGKENSMYIPSGLTFASNSVGPLEQITSLSAATVLKTRWYVQSSGANQTSVFAFYDRRLWIRPIKVG